MAKDPVCRMDVDPKTAAAQSSYKGEVIYFCAIGCKTKFDADPGRYLPASEMIGSPYLEGRDRYERAIEGWVDNTHEDAFTHTVRLTDPDHTVEVTCRVHGIAGLRGAAGARADCPGRRRSHDRRRLFRSRRGSDGRGVHAATGRPVRAARRRRSLRRCRHRDRPAGSPDREGARGHDRRIRSWRRAAVLGARHRELARPPQLVLHLQTPPGARSSAVAR